MKTEELVARAYKILILAIVILVLFTNLVLAYDIKKYYPIEQGNSWTYSVIAHESSYEETTRIEGKEIINNIETIKMLYAEDEYGYLAIDSEGLKKYAFDEDEYEIFNPPKMVFPDDLEIGEKRQYLWNSVIYGIDGTSRREASGTDRITLESVEDVDVPAGKFSNCLKFSSISDWKETNGSYGSDDCTIWLAPGIGKVKEFCFNTDYDAERKEESTSIETYELISAVIEENKIGRQE